MQPEYFAVKQSDSEHQFKHHQVLKLDIEMQNSAEQPNTDYLTPYTAQSISKQDRKNVGFRSFDQAADRIQTAQDQTHVNFI